MGEAKRRKLAGTYPVQDGGGPWFRLTAKDLSEAPAEVTQAIFKLLNGWLDDDPAGQQFVARVGSKKEALDGIAESVGLGVLAFGVRFARGGPELRLERAMSEADFRQRFPLPPDEAG